jgi:GTPase SAR1 family protein
MPVSKPPRKKQPSPPSANGARKPKKDEIMRDLRRLDRECQEMLTQTARFSPFLTNRELCEAGDIEAIENNAKILSRDTIELRNQLDAIRADIPRSLNPNKTDDVMKGLELGERFSEWQEKYQRAVLPTVERLGTLFEDAGKNLNDKRAEDNAHE